ncbi:hypothetical protein E2C01_076714 [Portunus trituberculatus]|uniref:Uncharacterized protein n=1 Tax=Portunus trituberculatus TaxID=210409 RepID=A0A5B7IJD0_PORTR|nr:hypothetical protein [Portunus trituberculatus]
MARATHIGEHRRWTDRRLRTGGTKSADIGTTQPGYRAANAKLLPGKATCGTHLLVESR